MRIGQRRAQIEIWSTTKSINEYGAEVEVKTLHLQCPAATKFVKSDSQGTVNKSYQTVVEFNIRFNRFFAAPNENCYIIWDNAEWDIVHTNNWYSQNRELTLTAVRRSR